MGLTDELKSFINLAVGSASFFLQPGNPKVANVTNAGNKSKRHKNYFRSSSFTF